MSKQDFLVRNTVKSSSYQFRSIIPKDLRNYFKEKHSFRVSVRTGIYRDARSKSLQLYALTHLIYDQIREGKMDLDIEGIKKILRVEIERSVKHSQHFKFDVGTTDVKRYESLLKNAIQKEDFKKSLDSEDERLVTKVDNRIAQHIKNLGYKSTKKSLQFKQLRAQFIELWLLRHELKKELLESKSERRVDNWFLQQCNERFELDLPVEIQEISSRDTTEVRESNDNVSPRTQLADTPRGKLISEVELNFLEWWNKRDNKEKTIIVYKTTIEHFIEIVGDIPIDTITSEKVFEYKDIYLKLPKNHHSERRFKGKSVDELLKMNIKETRSVYTMNQSLRRLSTFANWCLANTSLQTNPFRHATEKLVNKKKTQKHFTDEEILKIFDPEVFLPSTIQRRGYTPNRTGNYFIPLIMLYTGCRITEICQLHIDDLYKVNDIWIFDLNENECECCPTNQFKSIKNASSIRKIPIHPSLIEIGLCRYRNLVEKQGETRLFPKLNYQDKGGWSGAFSHFFNVTYLPKVGLKNLKDRKTDTHSFRHTCLNKMKSLGIVEGYAMEYAGHHHQSVTFTTYSARYDPSNLLENCVKKIKYKGLEINKLKVNWKKYLSNPPPGE